MFRHYERSSLAELHAEQLISLHSMRTFFAIWGFCVGIALLVGIREIYLMKRKEIWSSMKDLWRWGKSYVKIKWWFLKKKMRDGLVKIKRCKIRRTRKVHAQIRR
jgi:hypothetical protein